MSQEGIVAASHEDDNASTSHQAEQPASSNTPDTTTATDQQFRQTTPGIRSPSNAEPGPKPDSNPDQQSDGTVNEEYEDNDTPEVDAPAEEPLGSSKDPLKDYGWEDLEQRFATRMEECKKHEEALGQEFNEWLKVRLSQLFHLATSHLFRLHASHAQLYQYTRALYRPNHPSALLTLFCRSLRLGLR